MKLQNTIKIKKTDTCDAVIIAAPSSLHKKIALKVATAGKHLLVEKPIALSAEDAQEIVDAFADTEQVLQVGHVERFNPVVLELEKIINNEDVVAVHIERCSSMDRRISDTDQTVSYLLKIRRRSLSDQDRLTVYGRSKTASSAACQILKVL